MNRINENRFSSQDFLWDGQSFLCFPCASKKLDVYKRQALAYMNNQTFSHAAALAAYSEEGAAWLAEAKAYVQENARVFSRLLSAAGVPLSLIHI